jgi:hypothetical protein
LLEHWLYAAELGARFGERCVHWFTKPVCEKLFDRGEYALPGQKVCRYLPMKRLLGGDKKTAGDYFRKCLATEAFDARQYGAAQAELKTLTQRNPHGSANAH